MSFFMSLGRGPKLFIELAHWADRGAVGLRGCEVRRENGETLIWLGRLHMIYTPGRWRPVARGPTIDGRDHDDYQSRIRRLAS